MKILNKGTTTKNSFKVDSKKHKNFNWAVIRNVGITFASLVLIVWAVSSVNWSQLGKDIDYELSGWTFKYESKTYPVSQITIDDETDYYTDSQVNAGYALANYKVLRDKDMASAADMVKQNALNEYHFNVDEIDYAKVDLADSIFNDPYHSFTEVKYKKGLKEPEAKIYYELAYHHGKFVSKELKSDATLILPE